MRIWNDAETLSKIGRFLPYVPIIIGFAVAFSGQFLKNVVDGRVAKLKADIEFARKNTSPIVDVRLGHLSSSGEKVIEMDVRNETPFEASWLVTTKNNIVVSPIMTEKAKIVPRKPQKRFLYRITINREKVIDNYIELRFQYKSIYAEELGNQAHLSGEHVKRYSFVNGRIVPFDS